MVADIQRTVVTIGIVFYISGIFRNALTDLKQTVGQGNFGKVFTSRKYVTAHIGKSLKQLHLG